jgi:hypothetical protein
LFDQSTNDFSLQPSGSTLQTNDYPTLSDIGAFYCDETTEGAELDGGNSVFASSALTNALQYVENYTIQCWFKWSDDGNAHGLTTVGKYGNASFVRLEIDYDNDRIVVWTFSNTVEKATWVTDNNSTDPAVGEWCHYSAIRTSDGAVTIYTNGVALPTSLSGGSDTNMTVSNLVSAARMDSILVGCGLWETHPLALGKGYYDGAAMWNRALSADEIAQVATNASLVPTNGLIFYYGVTNTWSGTVSDESGKGHDGAMAYPPSVGYPPLISGGSLVAYYNQNVRILSHSDFDIATNVPLTLVCDYYPIGKDMVGAGDLISRYTSGGDGVFQLVQSTDTLRMQVLDSTAAAGIGRGTGSGSITNFAWYQIVATYTGGIDNASCPVYINGQQRDVANQPWGTFVTSRPSTNDVYIGFPGTGANYQSAKFDNVRIYKGVAWTQADVLNYWEKTMGYTGPARVTNAVIEWPMADGGAATPYMTDETGNGNTLGWAQFNYLTVGKNMRVSHPFFNRAVFLNSDYDINDVATGTVSMLNWVDDGSWSYWIKTYYTGASYSWKMAKGNAVDGWAFMTLDCDYPCFEVGTDRLGKNGTSINDGGWHLVSSSFIKAEAKAILYVDGVSNVSLSSITGVPSNNNLFVVGNCASWASQDDGWYCGPIGVWVGKAVTESEWLTQYTAGTFPAGATMIQSWTGELYRSSTSPYNLEVPGFNLSLGRIAQPTWTNYEGNGAFLFDGFDDYAYNEWYWFGNASQGMSNLWGSASAQSNITVSFWANPANTDGKNLNRAFCFYFWSTLYTYEGWIGGTGNGSSIGFGNNSFASGNYSHTATNTWTDADVGSWHHVVMSYDASASAGTRATIYKDGVLMPLVTNGMSGNEDLNNYRSLYIGVGNGDFYYGFLDDFRIYSRVLTADEVGSLFARGRE